MVEQTSEDFSSPAIQNAASLTEYERRLKRAARFGLDEATVVGPQFQTPAYDKMDLPANG